MIKVPAPLAVSVGAHLLWACERTGHHHTS
jgi:hypothetical protein